MKDETNNPLEDLLRKRMKEDLNEMEGPEESLKNELRARIKVPAKKEVHKGFGLWSLFSLKLKLHHVLLLCLFVGAITFYAGKSQSAGPVADSKNVENDSLNLASSSAKENMFLIKKFAVSMN